jgi:hypothetical protein
MRKVRRMLDKMSEAQRSMLQAAATREDRLLQLPGNARGAVAKSLGAKLIDAGWAKEIKASDGAPVWRREAGTGGAYGLRLTAKGLKAIAAASERSDGSENTAPPTAAEMAPPKAPVRKSALSLRSQAVTTESKLSNVASTTTVRPPRSGSKIADVLARLSAEAGATIGELTTATGWLEHTTRAALTGLRRRGYILSLTRRERDRASVYRVSSIGGEAIK